LTVLSPVEYDGVACLSHCFAIQTSPLPVTDTGGARTLSGKNAGTGTMGARPLDAACQFV